MGGEVEGVEEVGRVEKGDEGENMGEEEEWRGRKGRRVEGG